MPYTPLKQTTLAALLLTLPLLAFGQSDDTPGDDTPELPQTPASDTPEALPTDGSDAGAGGQAQAGTKGLLPLEELRTFTRVYDHIRKNYVEELSDTELLEYAIRGMIAELDPHSAYLDQRSYENLQENTSGEFGGIGIEVGMEDGFVKVISPIDDTPADEAGILAGDLIIRLDDEPVKGMTLNEAVERMRGPKGTELTLTVVREGVEQPFEVTLERDVIQVKSVRVELKDDHYAYVRIAQFQVNTARDMVDELKALREEHDDIRGIVLDLRNNPGGVLRTSVDVADAFLDEALVVYTEGRMENSNTRYYAEDGQIAQDLPMVALINDGSASASEIVAGALQDHGRAIVLGTRSFGKGSVQTVVPIGEKKAVKLTTALYFTPDGRSIQAQGIAPDVTVERARVTAINSRRATEADLVGHLGNANGSEESGTSDRAAERAEREKSLGDNQLAEAINLLKGLHIFQKRQRVEQPESEPAAAQEEAQTPARPDTDPTGPDEEGD